VRAVVAAVVLLLFVATGCSGSDGSDTRAVEAVSATGTVTGTATAAPRDEGQVQLLALVKGHPDEFPTFSTLYDTNLLVLGDTICDSLRLGDSIYDIANSLYSPVYRNYEEGILLMIAVTDSLCPQYKDLL
jgi:hypothetical protein